MIDYRYAYLIGSLITLLIWILLFYSRSDLRREMLTLSLLTMVLAPADILYYGHYWRPDFVINIFNFGIESIIVCFAYGGISGVIYEYIFRNTPHRLKSINLQISKIQVLISFILGVLAILALEVFTNVNIIFSTSTGLLVMGIFFIYFRSDLFVPAVSSAIIVTVLSVLVYWFILLLFPDFFDKFWIPDNITNIRLFLIPIEEYYFHLALGLSVGVLYEIEYGEYDKPL